MSEWRVSESHVVVGRIDYDACRSIASRDDFRFSLASSIPSPAPLSVTDRNVSHTGQVPSCTGEQRTPSFIFIGPAKVGSSWFTEILRDHPGIFVPLNKGTAFFTRFYGQGIDWYERFFSRAAGGAVIGEVCEEYLSSPEALRRIRDYRPDMRLICCLRNPYERAISAWRFYARNGCDQPNLASQAARNPQVFFYGYYGTQLQTVRSMFPQNQLLVFFFEELSKDPRGVARRLYEFIGADPQFVPTSLYRRVNVNGRPRWRALARTVHRIHVHSWGSSRMGSNLAGYLKSIRPLRRAVRAVLYDERQQASDWRHYLPEFPAEIVARYEQEISIVEQTLDRDLSEWRVSSASIAVPGSTAAIER